jgi:hypothetical protein
MIFSYLWTSSQASKRIRELNSKSKEIIKNDFITEFPGLFNEVEQTKAAPLRDVYFDDFADFNFFEFKDVHVHELDIYHSPDFLNGFEIYYLTDGDIMKYALHYKPSLAGAKPSVAAPKVNLNPISMLLKNKAQNATEEQKASTTKTTLYFKKHEYIRRIKISGQTYLHYMEVEDNCGRVV